MRAKIHNGGGKTVQESSEEIQERPETDVLYDGGKMGETEEEHELHVKYKSRNTQNFDADDSQDEGSGPEDGPDPTLAKTSLAYLQQQRLLLEREVQRNAQMTEVQQSQKALGANSDQDIKPNKRFKNFNDVFSGLTRSKNVVTSFPIISCMMTYNSRSAITVTKKDDREYWVKQYSLETNQMTFEEKFGGLPDSYIKMKEVR